MWKSSVLQFLVGEKNRLLPQKTEDILKREPWSNEFIWQIFCNKKIISSRNSRKTVFLK